MPWVFYNTAQKVTAAGIMINCTASQAGMSPLSTIATITLP